ncbi:T-lymphocyte activation antigen CD80 isoform X2 [Rhineura floridana]|uniref:T-lymphocyte activation antigen CD80 isoform X2 n=1 Tax=Rhineura floridana TaxID=261503 RepID=UPI002AC85308|nr:T-lymphocyte activation antigen CD80 isoform X2 [Rhineura floridana]
MIYSQKTELMFSRPSLKGFLWLGLFVLQSVGSGTVQITAKVGNVATLPCNYKMEEPLTSYMIYWQKTVHAGVSDLVVIAYSHGNETSSRNILYLNRTRMDEKNLTLWISSVKVSDEGEYKCVIILHENHIRNEHVYLSVEGDVSKPIIHVDVPHNACGPTELTLRCSSHGGYPQPEMSGFINNETVQWTYTSTSDNQTKLFNITGHLELNVSEDILVQCLVGYRRFQVSTNLSLLPKECPTVPPSPRSPPSHGIVIASVVILIFLVAVIGLTTFLQSRKHTLSHQPVATLEMTPQKLSNGTSETVFA